MARTNAVNFSGALQFPMANAATDLFKKEDVQTLALAVDGHDHSSGKGLVLPASAIPNGFITSAMIADQGIQASDIATSTITSVQLAAGAATNLIGAYQSIPSFSSSSTGTWVATPVAVSGAVSNVSGAYLLLFATVLIGGNGVAGGYCRLSIMMDGSPLIGSQALYQIPAAGISSTISMHLMHQPPVGNHTWAVGVLNNNAGTLGMDGATAASLIVLEMRR